MSEQCVDTPDGISWHTETFYSCKQLSSGPTSEYIVLIPSGEGDCHNLNNLAHLLSTSGPYNILTFDTPGMSRTTAPPEAHSNVTPSLLAKQIANLLDAMQINRASFFGCSSGGGATLALCAHHSQLVKCGIVHEVPLDPAPPILFQMRDTMNDEQIVAACEETFKSGLIEEENDGPAKWAALGHEYHERLKKNYVRWIKGYVEDGEPTSWMQLAQIPENLQRRPIFWTVGSVNPGAERKEGIWKANFEMAEKAGLTVEKERLMCLHFPGVTVAEDCARWIAECVGKVKD